jgi:hypothetical protein
MTDPSKKHQRALAAQEVMAILNDQGMDAALARMADLVERETFSVGLVERLPPNLRAAWDKTPASLLLKERLREQQRQASLQKAPQVVHVQAPPSPEKLAKQAEATARRLEQERVRQWRQNMTVWVSQLTPSQPLLKGAPEKLAVAPASNEISLKQVQALALADAQDFLTALEAEYPKPPEDLWLRLEAFEFAPRRTLTKAQSILDGRWGISAAKWRPILAPQALSDRERIKAVNMAAREKLKADRLVASQEQVRQNEIYAIQEAEDAKALNANEVIAFLGTTRYRLNKHVASGELRPAFQREFRKWGRTLEASYYRPEDVRALAALHYKDLAGKSPPPSRIVQLRQEREDARLANLDLQKKADLLRVWRNAFVKVMSRTNQVVYADDGNGYTTFKVSTSHPEWGEVLVTVQVMLESFKPNLPEDQELACPVVKDWARQVASAWMEDLASRSAQEMQGWPEGIKELVLEQYRREINISSARLPPLPELAISPPPVLALNHPYSKSAFHLAALIRADEDLAKTMREHLGFQDVPGWFPAARKLGRSWTVWLGPTNSGKTHNAIEKLKAAPSGVYLAPLRLMALETYDRLNDAGIACALRTGEERREPRSGAVATHMSATIEAGLDGNVWDVAVVDEAQMLADPERGWAWTQALVGVAAKDVCVCAAPEAEAVLRTLAKSLGEPFKVIRVERASPLSALSQPVQLRNIQAGDGLVAFSRKQVLGYRAWLRDHGHSVACIYGDLGPEVRQQEAERFRSGEASVLVATDAIGMGLNLPLKRVIMTETEKFDGKTRRPLTSSEWRQIGGRAGRRGFHEAGYVGVLSGLSSKLVAKELSSQITPLSTSRLFVQPSWGVVKRIADLYGLFSMTAVLEELANLLDGQSLWSASGLRRLAHAPLIQSLSTRKLSLRLQFDYLGCPVRQGLIETVRAWASRHEEGAKISLPHVYETGIPDSIEALEKLEAIGHKLTTYRWLALAFPKNYPHYDEVSILHSDVQQRIACCLSEKALHRLCASCGCRLKVDHVFPNCEPCHRSSRRGSWDDDDDDYGSHFHGYGRR